MLPRFRLHLSWREWLEAPFRSRASPEVLEETFKAVYGFREAVYFPYARTAIRAYLETLGVNGERVVLSPLNCIALAQGVTSAGGVPFYVDTVPDGFNLDPGQFRAALAHKKAKVGIITALWGMDEDPSLADGMSKPCLYDYALKGLSKSIPKLKPKDAVVYSLNWGKPLSAFRGAMLCSNSIESAISWREWRNSHLKPALPGKHWIEAGIIKLGGTNLLFGLVTKLKEWSFVQGMLGKTSDSQEMSAEALRFPGAWTFGIGVKHLLMLDQLRSERKKQCEVYRRLLTPLTAVTLPKGDHLSHFPVQLEGRETLYECLYRLGIFSSHRLYEKLLCDYPAFSGIPRGPMPNARKLLRTTLHLPLYHGLTLQEQERVADACSRIAPVVYTPSHAQGALSY